ncbi:DUF1993 domain-containing protein [Rhizorhabdus phycosphaerae]|uniref:DUF1993 domain-containing protein n=1 Tax=Rhizorhabdus phycosphaerae TaxID=2711156 RepID=UPI0013E9D162|nr:DUF1993 domain-containing protein [Rhizorhabdus phycosphaerae]
MALTALLIPTFRQMLRALDGWLGKAADHWTAEGRNPDDILALRLAPDMYPLASQLRFACFQAQEPVWRLRGLAMPDELLALRAGAWSPGGDGETLEEARMHIAGAIDLLGSVTPDALDAHAGQPIALELPNGMIFDMDGTSYARDWALPQFYFHSTTAYAILRSHGVPLGKPDYVPQMFAYIRPGTMPTT